MNEFDRYHNGFDRALDLAGMSQHSRPLYSEALGQALVRYFGPKMSHPRIDQWWNDHMGDRVQRALREFLPWIERYVPLNSLYVIEVGCGTGSSTVALAACAEHVLALDIDEASLEAARLRLKEDELDDRVTFELVDPLFRRVNIPAGSADVVVCYAVLEHMLPVERAECVHQVWKWLKPGGFFVIFETPNRLFPYDLHTTQLWAWSWLPAQLALRYGKWRGRLAPATTVEEMYREGYGCSYYELESLLRGMDHSYCPSREDDGRLKGAVARVLMRLFGVPRWALARDINVIIRKNASFQI